VKKKDEGVPLFGGFIVAGQSQEMPERASTELASVINKKSLTNEFYIHAPERMQMIH
jgi:hypothetical protein